MPVFAVGNSLADLVANVTIAQFAPNMAYAACFVGPLNRNMLISRADRCSIYSSALAARGRTRY